MATQYLDLVNKLLRRFNEVELTQSNFANVRGVQALAKDAILYGLNTINQQNWKWPFNYISGSGTTITCVVGQTEYTYPTSAEDVDFDNIYLLKNTSLSITATQLHKIGHDQYKRNFRECDLNATAAAQYGIPAWCFRTPGLMIGVSPKPKLAYTFTANYWIQPTPPSTYSDTTRIDTRFDDVIVDGGESYMYSVRKNLQQSDAADKSFQKGIKRMRTLLINDSADMSSTVSNVGRGGGGSSLYIRTL